ncbi:prephenate dehydrogenase [Edaphobacter albus]|uniref:prephenate dehydrogenase n=1 Tax=Edaphobacter sp. 4G125 TaxID=2763071 RepID=UPI001644788E|nr:prephenate dehydrogenase/arogenate dehydrogenase family protein [Edaphobacter sp. 4G125]QNI36707.1 prephenate dehydrogenase/arogenate dehydrogenase family protein [Edaphobacter sp. 4G125]
MIERVLIIGTGLIGASTGLALRTAGFSGRIDGWDQSSLELNAALQMGAVDGVVGNQWGALELARQADVVVLAVPVLAIKDWMQQLATVMGPDQLITDVGSTKLEITELAATLFGGKDQAIFLAGHPMAGKESGGALLAEASLFNGAMWLFTPTAAESTPLEKEWRSWVGFFGARSLDMDPKRHDEMCAWVSHLPQMLSTALAALLEDRFGDAPEIAAIGGRALRETTRLGASPYSMWRDVALTNTEPIAETLLSLEQRLTHVRENLRTPGLRDEFTLANRFRAKR